MSLSLSLGCDAAIVANGAGERVVATIGIDGGDIELNNGDVRCTLSVPALSLSEDTEITLQQVDIQGIDGEAAVRFSPDGLKFARAGLLTFEPAPIGDVVVGLAFSEGDTDADLVFTTPTDDGMSMPIEHFSHAAAVDAEAARQLLGEEDGDAATAVDVKESIALGLGESGSFALKDLGQDCLVVAEISSVTLESGEVKDRGDGTGRLSAITFNHTRTANGVTITATGTLLAE